MVHVYYGDMPDAIYNPSIYFKNTYDGSWIMDDLSKQMIKDVDQSEVLGPRIIEFLMAMDDYIESSLYFSWERFFTRLLMNKTQDSYLKYSKKSLNSAYLKNGYPEKICNEMAYIRLI